MGCPSPLRFLLRITNVFFQKIERPALLLCRFPSQRRSKSPMAYKIGGNDYYSRMVLVEGYPPQIFLFVHETIGLEKMKKDYRIQSIQLAINSLMISPRCSTYCIELCGQTNRLCNGMARRWSSCSLYTGFQIELQHHNSTSLATTYYNLLVPTAMNQKAHCTLHGGNSFLPLE